VKGLRTMVARYNKNRKCSTDILPGVLSYMADLVN
jgi:hypothetical protein